jgi:hypothetical protein
MDRRLSMLLIGLVFGGGIGFTIAAGNSVTFDGHDHATGHGGGGHDHSAITSIDLPASDTAPTLAAQIFKDQASGWNLKIEKTNFTFAPQNASKVDVTGEGHAHLYVNGDKTARLYADWFHIDHLPEGDVLIEVALNSNDHSQLSVDGVPLRVGVQVINTTN